MIQIPMLACSKIPTFEALRYPLIASYKLDGIRALVHKDRVVSRTLKLIPNDYIRATLASLSSEHVLDGELSVSGEFDAVQSAVMSRYGRPDFVYHVFDVQSSDSTSARLDKAADIVRDLNVPFVQLVEQFVINNEAELVKLYDEALSLGYEGLILRKPTAPYKHGRSTLLQGWMLKLKPFVDDEATVIGANPLMRNHNDPTINAVGSQVRGHSIANKVEDDLLGSLHCAWKGVTFDLGTGYSEEQRHTLWQEYLSGGLVGQKVTFKYQGVGTNGRPRFPVFLHKRLAE